MRARAILDTHLGFQKQVSMQSEIDLVSPLLAAGVGCKLETKIGNREVFLE